VAISGLVPRTTPRITPNKRGLLLQLLRLSIVVALVLLLVCVPETDAGYGLPGITKNLGGNLSNDKSIFLV